MSSVNLLQLVSECEVFSQVHIIGKLEGVFDPKNTPFSRILVDTQEDGNVHYAILRIHAIKYFNDPYSPTSGALLQKYAGTSNGDIYFACGSVAIGIKESDLDKVGKEVIVYGITSGHKVKIKRQKCKDPTMGYAAFSWSKLALGWVMRPNAVELLDNTMRVVRATDLRDRIDVTQGIVTRLELPSELDNMKEISALSDELMASNLVPIDPPSDDSNENLEGEEGANGGYIVPEKSIPQTYEATPEEKLDVSTIDLKLVKHLSCQPLSPKMGAIKDLKDSNVEFRKDFSEKVLKSLWYQEMSLKNNGLDLDKIGLEIHESYISNIASRYDFQLSLNDPAKGKYFVDSLISNMYNSHFIFEGEGKYGRMSEQALKTKSAGLDRIKSMVSVDPRAISRDFSEYLPILEDPIAMASLIIGNITGIGESTITSSCNSCLREGVSKEEWFLALLSNPYKLGMVGLGLKLVDCDKLYFTFISKYQKFIYQKFSTYQVLTEIRDENRKYRNYLILMESLKKAVNDTYDTIIPDYKIMGTPIYSKPEIDWLKNNGVPLKNSNKIACELVLGMSLKNIPYRATIRNPVNSQLVDDMCSTGVIVKTNEGIATTRDLEKDLEIYTALRALGVRQTGITDDEIDSTINQFEQMRGFPLESLQRDGIKLTKTFAGVLSGCAGSGKTTTSECMSMVLGQHFGSDYKIIYGTPTGKACRRLAEVVGGDVRTLHSLFGVGIESTPYLSESTGHKNRHRVGESEDDKKPRIYILDEMAMCSSDLLYEVVRCLEPDDMIYFLGDVKQLPPIGRGVPFSVLMDVLPCVELGVSKRAASGSLINYNCMLINFVSDGRLVELRGGDDFLVTDCENDVIVKNCCDIFKGLINGTVNGKKYNEDDIQVITEYRSPSFAWATGYLNPPLQKYLRTEINNDRLLFTKTRSTKDSEPDKFYKNDRVIHVNQNSYSMKRYRRLNEGYVHFEEVPTFGAVNGEMGKLVHVGPASAFTLESFNEEDFLARYKDADDITKSKIDEVLEVYKKKSDTLRDDTSYQGSNAYCLVVEFDDNDLNEKVYVLYRAFKKNVKSSYDSDINDDLVLVGGDLPNLDLAYALTAHKMQGSQSQAVIAVFGNGGSANFVNRNMINVIITRSQEFVALVGDVSGVDSAITKGRRIKARTQRRDFLNELSSG